LEAFSVFLWPIQEG